MGKSDDLPLGHLGRHMMITLEVDAEVADLLFLVTSKENQAVITNLSHLID